ncbi:MAG: AEC family transporter [Clostridiales bacterium]|nr:AEC family transporter [Clostridiales bacterium]
MSLAAIVFEQVLVILVIIVIGMLCYKIKLIDEVTSTKLNNILLSLVLPIVIIVSYQREFSIELFNGLLISFLLALITHIFSILLSIFLFRKKKGIIFKEAKSKSYKVIENEEYAVERYSIIYSNSAFMGIPLINGIFGSEGVFYATAYITIWNIFTWTHGAILMDKDDSNRIDLKSLIIKLKSPTIIAIIIGLILFLLQIKLPKTVLTAFEYISNLNTPFAMIIAGVTIGQTSLLKTIKKFRIYIIAFIRLLLIPLVLLLVYSLFPINEIVLLTSIVLAACPTATMVILLSIRYKQNSIYASEVFAITTILSSISLPLIIKIAEMIIV